MIDDFTQPPGRQPGKLNNVQSMRGRLTQPQPNIIRPTPAFMTPDQAAARDTGATAGQTSAYTVQQAASPVPAPVQAPAGKPKGRTITLFKRWTVSRKKFIIAAAAAVLLIGGSTAFALTRGEEPAPPKPVAKVKVAPPAPKPILSPLTGIPVSAEQRDLPVTGVMIENSPNARPQSGLKDAGVIFEAIAEAGITRFLALYQETQPGNVGPIRSARPYFLDWAMAFDASYAHVGGSPDALQRIKDIGTKDLDQFFNPSAYHRITSRYAPHNMYSGVDQLLALGKSKGWEKSSFTSLERKSEQPYKAPDPAAAAPAPASSKPGSGTTKPAATPKPAGDTRKPATAVSLGISGAYYNVNYGYDAATNTYKRLLAGTPHVDADSGTHLAPKVVVALAMPYGLMADGYHSQYTTTGSGKMFVFQDGTVTAGVWSKGQPKEQFVFKDDTGKILALNPGQTWISIVSDPAAVTFQ